MFASLRRAFRDLSIKRKLIAIVTLTSALVLALACGGFVLHDVLTFREFTTSSTRTLASIIAKNTVGALEFDERDSAHEVLSALVENPSVIGAWLDRDDRPFARYLRAGATMRRPEATSRQAFTRFVQGHLELGLPVTKRNGDQVGMLYLVTDSSELDARLHRYITIAAGLLVAAVLVAYLLASRFQRVISAPVSDLAELTRRVTTERDYSRRAQRHARDELGALCDGFNGMLAQIQQRDSALQAAHEELEGRVRSRTRELQEQIFERLTAEKALQHQLTRISLLNQIANAMSDRQDLDRIVNVVLAQLEQHLATDFGSVSIHVETREHLEIAAVRRRGASDEAVGQSLAPFGPVDDIFVALGDCRRGNQVYFPETARASHVALRRFAAEGLHSLVAIPLMTERRFFGLLLVARAAPDAFTSGETEFLRMLGEQVAIAGSQARLYSELQRAYTELRQSQRAMMQQERLRALGQMASGIAHDINNTLTPIVTFAELLLEHEKNLSERARRCLRNIQTASSDISTIVARLREFYRPRDVQEPHVAVDVRALLTEISDLTRPRWRDMPQARGIVIVLKAEFSPEAPPVAGNPTELRESITNLILNAVDAMPEGGTLTLRSRFIADTQGRGAVAIEVADTGIGMDDATRQRCLEPFFSTKGQRGTGLGLAMVYGVMERHNGRIEIESAPGSGTTIRLLFPVAAPAKPGSVHPFNGEAKAVRPLRVLCIDDEPMVRTVLVELFQVDGHEANPADSAEHGLKLFRSAVQSGRPYDVVVTDLGMPHMDGRQLAQIVKRESPATPVILLTGWGRIMQEDNEHPHDVDLVLSKPPRPSDVREALMQLIGKGERTR